MNEQRQPEATVDHSGDERTAPPTAAGPDPDPESTEAGGASVPTLGDDPAGGATVETSADRTAAGPAADSGPATVARGPGARREPPRIDRIKIPSYRILGELGRGGMGVVYKAEHTVLNRVVALKVILAGSHAGSEQLARFLTEAQAVAKLQSPDVVQIFDIGETEGLPYFSLEYVEGGSLESKLDGEPQDPRWAAELVEALARAMQEAHGKGIVHRDLKPANILMTAAGRPKITDFGLARRLETDSGQTRSGSIMGTPSYMAPEQAHGETRAAGPAADLYSLGAILYTTLTGRPPHQGTTILETLDLVRTREPLPPSQLQPKVPRDLETICLKCLQKEPARRYDDAGALADDLRRYLDGAPILARPVSAPERAWRWTRRHPRDAGALAAVALLVVAVIATLTVSAGRLRASNRALNTSLANESEAKRLAGERADLAERKTVEAQANLRKALEQNMETINAWRSFGKTSYEDLRGIPGTDGVRLRLLDEVKQGLETSLRQMKPLYEAARVDAANAKLIDHAMAGVYHEAAETLVAIGKVGEAAAPLAEMDRIYEDLADRYGAEDDHYLWTLAIGKKALGSYQLQSLGDAGAAERNFRAALDLSRRRLANAPDDGDRLRFLAGSLGALANVALRNGRPEEARTYYDEEVAVRESIPEPLRSAYEVRRELSGLHEKLGDLCLSLGDPDGARDHLERSFENRRALAAADPENVPNLRDIYRSYEDFGHFALMRLADPEEARTYYRQAADGMAGLVARDERSAVFREDLALAHYFLATALLKLGDREGSLESYRRCRDLRRPLASDPEARVARLNLMLALARCGDHDEAATIARDLIARDPRNAQLSVEAACGLALCSGAAAEAADADRARSYADEAVAALRDAIGRGWRDVDRLKVDPDLDPIRDDPAFVALLDDPEAAVGGGD